VLSTAIGSAQAQQLTSRVGYLQDDDTETREEQPNRDLQQEIEKLEFRLRELEDDFDQQQQSGEEDNEQAEPEDDYGDRFAELEKSLDSLTESVDDLDGALPGLVYHSHGSPKLKFYGRIHIDYWTFPNFQPGLSALESTGDPQDLFNFRRLRTGVSGELTDNIVYKYEGEFAGGNVVGYRDAYLGVKDLPFFGTILIGNQKRPYSLDQLNSSHHNVFVERPFVAEAFNINNRRLGVASYGVSQDQKYNWRFGLYHQEETQSASGFFGDRYQMEFAARLASTPWYDEASDGRGFFHWAISGSVGDPDGFGGADNQARFRARPEARTSANFLDTGAIVGANTNLLLGLESVFNYGPFNITAEYMRSNVDRFDAVGPALQFHGGYIQASYFLTGESLRWDRRRGTLGRLRPFENAFKVKDCDGKIRRGLGAWQVAARYSYVSLNDQDIVGGDASAATLALNWWWNSRARWQFNYNFGAAKTTGPISPNLLS